jgi:hypothetical protein
LMYKETDTTSRKSLLGVLAILHNGWCLHYLNSEFRIVALPKFLALSWARHGTTNSSLKQLQTAIWTFASDHKTLASLFFDKYSWSYNFIWNCYFSMIAWTTIFLV